METTRSSERFETEKLLREVARLQKKLADASKIIDVRKTLGGAGVTLEKPPAFDEDD